MNKIKLLIPIILASCTPTEEYIHQWRDEELSFIYSAEDEWALSLDNNLVNELLDSIQYWNGPLSKEDWENDHGYPVIVKTLTSDPGYKYLQDGFGGDFLGACSGVSGNVVIVADSFNTIDDFFKIVVMHELGHLLGLSHSTVGLMYSDDKNIQSCIDEATFNASCQIWQCGSEAIPTCE